METLHWFRLYGRTIDNEKLGVLAPSDRWYYIAILCCKAQGILDAGDNHSMLKRKLCSKLQLTMKELEDLSARLQEVTLVTDSLQPIGWNEKQYVTDTPSYNAEKQRKYRERNRALRNSTVTVTAPETDTDTDTEKDKTLMSSRPAVSDPCPYQKIVDLYHQTLPAHPKVRVLTQARKSVLKQRHVSDMESDLETWASYFKMVGRSEFLTGKAQPVNGRRVFIADLEWITKQGNFVKIFEGKYHGQI